MPLITTVIQHLCDGNGRRSLAIGVKEGDYWCGALLYADDVVLLAESSDELQKMLDMMGQYAEE